MPNPSTEYMFQRTVKQEAVVRANSREEAVRYLHKYETTQDSFWYDTYNDGPEEFVSETPIPEPAPTHHTCKHCGQTWQPLHNKFCYECGRFTS
jgi:hypothetical protein